MIKIIFRWQGSHIYRMGWSIHHLFMKNEEISQITCSSSLRHTQQMYHQGELCSYKPWTFGWGWTSIHPFTSSLQPYANSRVVRCPAQPRGRTCGYPGWKPTPGCTNKGYYAVQCIQWSSLGTIVEMLWAMWSFLLMTLKSHVYNKQFFMSFFAKRIFHETPLTFSQVTLFFWRNVFQN